MAKQDVAPSLTVFLCYASDAHLVAEELYHALVNAGHRVFFDRRSITTAGEHHAAISAAIELSDVAVHVISPKSIEEGAYTRSELRFMSETWPSARGRLISVLPQHSPVLMAQVPAYAKSVGVLRPEGDLVAEVVQEVKKAAKQLRPMSRLDADELRAIESALARLDTEWEKGEGKDRESVVGCALYVLGWVFVELFFLVIFLGEDLIGRALLIPGVTLAVGLIAIGVMIRARLRWLKNRRIYQQRRAALRNRFDQWLHETLGE